MALHLALDLKNSKKKKRKNLDITYIYKIFFVHEKNIDLKDHPLYSDIIHFLLYQKYLENIDKIGRIKLILNVIKYTVM